jgi:hypothetical protein
MTVSRSAKMPDRDNLRMQLAIAGGVIVIAALTGPFGTFMLPLGTRLLMWGVLIGWNMAKWIGWTFYVLPRAAGDPKRELGALAIGILLLNAPIGWEVEAVYAAVGQPIDLPNLSIWIIASSISLTIAAVVFFAKTARGEAQFIALEAPLPPLFRRAGLHDAAQLLAVEAEDHYVRLHLADGRQPLILYRFSDALADLADLPGLQVHRGAWVAKAAVTGAKREGRNWQLTLSNGAIIAVGGSFVGAVRDQGLLAPTGRPL